jgi:hypothetical protein
MADNDHEKPQPESSQGNEGNPEGLPPPDPDLSDFVTKDDKSGEKR